MPSNEELIAKKGRDMKCIHCGSRTRYRDRDRNGGKCLSCGRQFAFEPKTDAHKVTDHHMWKAIQDVSGEGQLFFTDRQLWHEFNRRFGRKRWGWAAAILAVVLLAVGFYFTSWVWVVFGLLVAAPVVVDLIRRAGRPRQMPVAFGTFRAEYLNRWTATHGRPERLLGPPETQPWREPASRERDLQAYSFDRALVTDRAETAAFLVANNFHFENNCVLLSVDGYPSGLTEALLDMLWRNPALTIYALHDASPQGCRLPLVLRQPAWFPDQEIRLLDLGLRPRHVKSRDWLTLQQAPAALTDDVRAILAPGEAAWLEHGYAVEVAAYRPAQLMKIISRGLGRPIPSRDEADTEAGDVVDGGDVIWFHDSGSDVDVADSFG